MPWSKISVTMNEPVLCDVGDRECARLPYAEAIRQALDLALQMDPAVFVMGQGVDDPSGMFGITKDLHKKYGPHRVFDTPVCESALMGIANGAAIGGMKPVYFHNRPDFLYLAMDQLVNHASKWSYMSGGAVNVPVVVWACIGRGWGSGPQHSQAPHAMFMHVPGLKLTMPATAFDAKGLMLEAIADPNPVVIIEHRYNFRHMGLTPIEPYRVPFGKAAVRRAGKDLTIVAVSHMVTEAVLAANDLALEGFDCEVIDPRTLRPLDEDMILDSSAKTGRVVVADCGWKTCGAAAEIAALIAEKGFRFLKGPIRRVTCPDLPTPAGHTLETAYYVGREEIAAAAKELLEQ